jgi:hypothetical protein
MCRDAKPQDLPPTMAHDQQPIEQPNDTVGTTNRSIAAIAVRMIMKKRLPAVRRRSPPPRHVFGYAGLAYIDPDLEQLTMDPRGSP